MDLSKLPRLSKTDRPGGSAEEASQAGEQQSAIAEPEPLGGAGPEAWISIAIGIIILLMQPNLLSWVKSCLFGGEGPAPFVDGAGKTFTYAQSQYFMHDLGLGVFALSLLLDGVVLILARKTAFVAAALLATCVAAVWNLATVVRFYPTYGLQFMPAMATAFAVYAGIYQWNLLMRCIGSVRPIR